MRRIFIVWHIIYYISATCVGAQFQQAVQDQYKFKYLTVDGGLSNNNVRSICQDSKGFIWLATQNGLNKFNRQSNVAYRNDPNDSTSISSNDINSVFLDSKNNLWCGTAEGLDLYNSDFDNFKRFSHKDIDRRLINVEDVVEDDDGDLWIATETGLLLINLNTSEIHFFSSEEGNPYGLPPNRIYRLLVDRNNKLWISVLNEGLCLFDKNVGVIKFFKNDPEDNTSISSNRIECLYEDRYGTIWAGTLNDGLNCYLPGSNSFIRSVPDPGNSYSTRVRAIFEDLKGNLFVGTRCGLYIRNDLTGEFSLYAHDGHNFSNLSQNSITTSYIDKAGTLWIGTFSGGANYANLNKKEFIHYIAGKNDDQFLRGANIYSITEDQQGNLWIGSDNGLDYLDRTSHTFKYYFNDPNDPYSISYNDIKALDWDKKGNLWIGTNRGGLNYYNTKTGKFKSYVHDPDNPNSLAGDKIYGLMNDKDNNLWILLTPINSYQFLNIDILPNGSDKFIHLDETGYFGIDQDEIGNVYIGGIHGFWIFTFQDSLFSFIPNDSIIHNVNTIRKDSEECIWIGSSKGLVRYCTKDQSFVRYSEDNGYPISEVFGILEDDTKSLWVSTNNGLVKITNIVEDTANIKFRVFDSEDGIQSKQFNYNAFYKCKAGEMVFGGINGFNTFFPDQIIENIIPPNVVLTDLKIINTTVPIGQKVGGHIILNKSISVTDEITLGPEHNIFTLEFTSLQNVNPEQNIFKIKLEGLDKDWQYRKAANNFVTYTNLSAGEYTFLVTASNNDGVWNEEPVKLSIIILPPFWQTWWFRMLVVLAVIAVVVGIYYYRLRSIRNQNKVLEETVKHRTLEISDKNEEIVSQKEELEQHRNKLESLVKEKTLSLEAALVKAKESDKLKSAFLANMSHEIRTPMNAITGFSSLLNDKGLTSEDRNDYIQIIESNSNDLLKIIDEIMDLSLIESDQLKLTKETFELNVMLDQLFSYYFLNNKNSKIELRKRNKLKNGDLRLNSDSIRLKQIIINLMDNAFKFTREGYVEIGAFLDGKDLCIYVEDTGRGIPSENIDRIFQQFTKVEDDEAGWTRGLGLGLTISQKIADALGGRILVNSAHDEGSTFTFCIPLNKVITEEEIVVRELREPVLGRWKGKTILIAEDIEENFLYLEKVLRKTQTDIIWAKNGEEALQRVIESPKIDLILMDIKMPKMDGYEAANKIKEHNPDQIIIAQTAYARDGEKLQYYDKNFDEYLSKPIKYADLLIVLEKFL